MSLLSFLLGEKKKTASVAKERLQIILAHERSGRGAAARLPAGAAARAGRGDLEVRVDQARRHQGAPGAQDNLEVLEVKIELPEAARL